MSRNTAFAAVAFAALLAGCAKLPIYQKPAAELPAAWKDVPAQGQPVTGEDFIAHWLGRILFYHAPPWVFAAVYSAFGLLVLWSWFAVRPGRR